MTSFLQDFLSAGQDGLQLIATAVLPVLFPFFVLTTLILNLTTATKPWLVAALAYCSGYPNGARLTQNLYLQHRLNLPQAQHLLIITATPSPIFVIATAGTVFLQDTLLGCVIMICAVVAALLNGSLWRLYAFPKATPPASSPNIIAQTTQQPPRFMSAFSDALTSATTAIINVCGVVLFFYITARLLHLPTELAGLLEMTTGVAATTNPLLIQFFVTFGGLSVAMQQQIFMQNFHIKFGTYLAYKITHALLACALLSLYLLFLN
ncbi:MAG: hypothetical protein NC133_02485 [Prevotella sp.]|nr:hypothetical protein [Prevotella sp.]